MKFNVNQNDLQQSFGYCQGVIEKEVHFQFSQTLWTHQTQN